MQRLLIALALTSACTAKQSNGSSSPPPAEAVAPAPRSPSDAAPGATAALATDGAPEARADVKPGINARFRDPELDVEHWKKIFEGESREVFAARHEVLDALKLQPGQAAADIGAGTGFYLWSFANAVGPTGHVYGVEISPRFLEALRGYASEHAIDYATIVEGSAHSTKLPEGAVDLVFICDTYHHFEYPASILASIRRALRPGGSLVVIDFERIEGKSSPWAMDHVRAGKEVVRGEIESAGFTFVDEPDIAGLHDNYMIRFRVGQ
jgi:ubiquinone/menaquinone biosynthesis C-methylase UbiE